MNLSKPVIFALLISAIFIAGHFAWYGETAFGLSPVLDGRENIELAHAIAEHGLPHEPFYRAPLYPTALALLLKLGFSGPLLPWAARWLNALAIFVSTICAGKLAMRLWASELASVLAAILVGFNPVILFFASDPYDILWATAFLTAAMFVSTKWLQEGGRRVDHVLWVSALLGIGSLVRSHLLLLALTWPVLAAWYAKGSRWHAFVAGCFGAALALIGLGAANFAISGEWRMTPWQGAYNAWAANGPQSNGRFFTQTVRVNFENGFDNPARLESIRLYQSETGVNPPFGIDAMNHYWTAKTVRYVTAHPFAWFRLLMRKVYSLIHNHEQYDNKTYAFEKSFAPWLKWDPLNWGLLSAIATGSFLALRPRTSSGPALLFWFIFVYAAGVVLFHTNNRFRVPLIPALAAIASGVVVWIRELGPALWRKIAVIGIVAALIFPPWFNVAGSDTRAQDCILYSGASLTIGRDAEAKLWAERGLALRPDRDDLREMIILAEFNLFATDLTAKLTRTTAVERLETCLRLKEPEFETRYVAGMYAWKLSRREDALRLWKSATNGDLATIHAGAMTALLLHFSTEPGVREIANQIPLQKRSAQLHVAMADYGDAASASWLSNHLSSEAQTQLRASLDHLFLPLADGSVKKP